MQYMPSMLRMIVPCARQGSVVVLVELCGTVLLAYLPFSYFANVSKFEFGNFVCCCSDGFSDHAP